MTSTPPLIRLLVIDDDPILCDLLQHTLPNQRFDVTAESSPLVALEGIVRGERGADHFDAILIDSQMPECHGAELAVQIRGRQPGALLIGMSATAPPVAELQAYDAFLLKPFTATQLRTIVDHGKPGDEVFGHPVETYEASAPHAYSGSLPESERRNELAGLAQSGIFLAPKPTETKVLDARIFEQLRATLGLEPLRQLYEMTVNDVASRLHRMRTSLLAGDLHALRAQAHAIKGSCAMVGATELSRLADGIELGSETDMVQLNAIEQACIRLRQMVTIVPP